MLGSKLNDLIHSEGSAAITSLIDVVVDSLSLLLLVCAIVLLLCWRFASRRRARYELASGNSTLELSSAVPNTTLGVRCSDGATEDPDTAPRPAVILDRHAHDQLLETQRQMLVLMGDLTAEVRTLQYHGQSQTQCPRHADARSGRERLAHGLAALTARQHTIQEHSAIAHVPDPEAAVAVLEDPVAGA